MGMDEQLVRRVLRLVNINEFKRHQTAPVLRVSPKHSAWVAGCPLSANTCPDAAWLLKPAWLLES